MTEDEFQEAENRLIRAKRLMEERAGYVRAKEVIGGEGRWAGKVPSERLAEAMGILPRESRDRFMHQLGLFVDGLIADVDKRFSKL